MKRISIVLLILFTCVVSVQWAQAGKKPYYTVIDVGTLGGSQAYPVLGVSNSGWVAGYSLLLGDTSWHALVWRNGVMTDLGTLGGPNSETNFNLNQKGDTPGMAETATPDPNGEDWCGFGTYLTCLPFVWRNGVMTPLPTLGGNNGMAQGINNRGQVVGVVQNAIADQNCDPYGDEEPVIWAKGRAWELPNFPGDLVGAARVINDRGQIIGWSGPCDTRLHPLLWDHGEVIDLGNLGGGMGYGPMQINNWGQIVGESLLPDQTTADQAIVHAFLWQNGVMSDLGALAGDVGSAATDINNKGQIVGGSWDADGNEKAVVWQKGALTDLNSLIDPNSPLYLLEADGINDSGQIVGYAYVYSSGNTDIFLAVPGHRKGMQGGSMQRPKPNLPENVRKLIQQRRATLSGTNGGHVPLR